jgi:hypothetical protein
MFFGRFLTDGVREVKTAMRLSVALLVVAVLLVAGMASAGRVSPVAPPHVPDGTYWDAERGLLVLEEPIPVYMPQSNLLGDYGNMLYYDNGMMYYLNYQQEDYFAATKFPVPTSETGLFELRAVMLACFNDPGVEPEEGKVVIYFHESSPDCYQTNPEGDRLGEVWVYNYFTGMPYSNLPDPYNPPMVSWTVVELSPTIIIDANEHEEFWIAWDYRPGSFELGGYYTVGGFNGNMGPGDDMRFFEEFGSYCPSLMPSYGPWLIRGLGESLAGPPKHIDIKTTSCPNPIKFGDIGDVQVGVIASRDWLEIGGIDPESFELVEYAGGPGNGAEIGRLTPYKKNKEPEDLTTPVYSNENCECTELGPDGLMDWSFRFQTSVIWQSLLDQYDVLENGCYYAVEFQWEMANGDQMVGHDCFWVNVPGFDYGEQVGGGGETMLGTTRVGDASVFALHQNAPNPFRGSTTINLSLPSSSHTRLTVHDVSGRTVATLVDGELTAGTHAIEWNANVPSGVYFCRLVAGGETAGMRMVVAR